MTEEKAGDHRLLTHFGRRLRGALLLDVRTFEEIEADTTSTPQALLVVALASLSQGLLFVGHGLPLVVAMMAWTIILWVLWAGLVYLVGTRLMPEPATRASWGELARTVGFAYAPGIFSVLAIVPALGALIEIVVLIWTLLAFVIAVRQALDYTSTARAVLVCLIGWLVFAFATRLI